jgi:uncharacterized Fe-S center protein
MEVIAMVPKMYKIKVKFDDNSLKNVEDKLGKELDKLNLNIKKGSRIAITAGSRGIDRIPILLKTVVQKVRELGGEPFVVPTMGSHGGATALGQVKILEELGITCKSVGAEILSTMDVVQIGQFNSNTSLTADTGKIPIVMDKNACCKS